jgi:Flp pilus assembly protein TadD
MAKALALDAGNSTVEISYGDLLAALGRLPQAIQAVRKGAELDPLSSDPWNDRGVYLTANKDFAAARDALMRALQISPGSEFALSNLVVLDLLSHQPSEALATARQIQTPAWRSYSLALSEHSAGHAHEAEQALQTLLDQHSQEAAYQIAQVYAWRGEKDKAFEWLERAYQQHDNGITTLKYTPLLDNLSGDPRYAEMLRKVHLSE